MTSYRISVDEKNSRVFLENSERISLQLSLREFNLLMTYPYASKEEITDIFYLENKELGKKAIYDLISKAFKILGRD